MTKYRDATLADGAELNAMARQSFVETFTEEYAPADFSLYLAQAYGPDGLIAALADPSILFRVAIEDGAIVGYAKLTELKLPAPDPLPGAQELGQLYVLKGWHGSGIATALMDWSIDTARERGARELYLAVFEFNHRAQAFYTRYGFEEVGAFDFHVGNRIDRDRIWRLAL